MTKCLHCEGKFQVGDCAQVVRLNLEYQIKELKPQGFVHLRCLSSWEGSNRYIWGKLGKPVEAFK